jgi:hypothetical protein
LQRLSGAHPQADLVQANPGWEAQPYFFPLAFGQPWMQVRTAVPCSLMPEKPGGLGLARLHFSMQAGSFWAAAGVTVNIDMVAAAAKMTISFIIFLPDLRSI